MTVFGRKTLGDLLLGSNMPYFKGETGHSFVNKIKIKYELVVKTLILNNNAKIIMLFW